MSTRHSTKTSEFGAGSPGDASPPQKVLISWTNFQKKLPKELRLF